MSEAMRKSEKYSNFGLTLKPNYQPLVKIQIELADTKSRLVIIKGSISCEIFCKPYLIRRKKLKMFCYTDVIKYL